MKKISAPLFALFTGISGCSPAVEEQIDTANLSPEITHCLQNPDTEQQCLDKINDRLDDQIKRLQIITNSYADTAYHQGLFLMHNDRHLDAKNAFKEAISIKPNFIEAHIGMGAACLSLRDLSCAMQELKTAKSLSETQEILPETREDLKILDNILRSHQI